MDQPANERVAQLSPGCMRRILFHAPRTPWQAFRAALLPIPWTPT
jgi:hypothetical protein